MKYTFMQKIERRLWVETYGGRLKWNLKKDRYITKEAHLSSTIKLSQVSYYAADNAGDTVLSQCVRRFFEKEYRRNIGWNLIPVIGTVSTDTIASINSTSGLIIGGGGLFLPDTNRNNISGWQWAISEELLETINVPIFVYSVGFNYFPGQIPSELFKQNLKSLCEKASFVGLRNSGSVNAIKELLPEAYKNKIQYQPCTTTLIRKIYGDALPQKVSSNKIAINMAFDRAEMRFQGMQDKICNDVAIAAKRIEDAGYEIWLVYHCDDDRIIRSYMKKQGVSFKEKSLCRLFPSQIFEFYNNIELVLGMRGHAQMIPFGLNCKIITLGTHDKMRWFLEDIDATDWYIDLNVNGGNLSSDIYSKFLDVIKSGEKTNKRIKDAQDRLWNISQNNMSQISKVIRIEKSEDK